MTIEMGKSLAESRAEITYANEFLRWFSEEAVRIDGRYAVSPNGQNRLITMRQPVGPCLLITPWNFPLAMGTRKVAPAVAAGCTMVVKPAKQTPLSMLAFAAIMQEAGLPAGVLNVVTTSHAGQVTDPLFDDERLRKLSFTGSTEIGRQLAARAMDRVLRVSMELGGNAPFLVFEDADLDAAVDGAMLAKLRNMGEACTSANRFHVAAPLAEEFAARLAKRMEGLRLGRGTEPDTDLGPLIDQTQREKVQELVGDAVGRGAKVLTGGEPLDGPGYFYRPTVLSDVPPASRLLTEEIFGPVAPIVSVRQRGRGPRRRQPDRVRTRRLRLHARSEPRAARRRGPRDRDGRPQPGDRLERRRALRRHQAVGLRPRRRQRRHQRVPLDQVRRAAALIGTGSKGF
jgi:succinate-semialdehyde dehydrogenase/glutarate-semialdehyde dehydrogenase